MKKIYIFLITWLVPVIMIAQETDAFNYQAVVRDPSGQIVANQTVNFRISLLLDRPEGAAVYSENHLVMTNNFGLVNLEIGHGMATSGDFSRIDWTLNNYYLEVAIDMEGGTDFTVLGASRLLSVPYALYAKYAGNSFSGSYYDLQDRPEGLSFFVNDAGYLTLGDLQQLDPEERDGLFMNGIPSQTWSLFGNSKSDPDKDKLGTTDSVDLVMVTNDTERLRIEADGDISLQNSLLIGEDLTVNRNVFLNATGGYTQNFGPFTVENSSATYLTGILDVDGATSLHSTLEVDGDADMNSALNVDGATTLNGTLDVDGASSLHSTLEVDGNADMNSALNVDGATTLNSTLNASGATSLGSSLSVAGATTLSSTLAANGQVTISTSVAGGDGSYGAYPLRVEGSDQGIAVKVNGTRNNNKNFITFWDGNGRQGRIEGQTSAELHASFDYIWFQTQEALQTAFQLAMVVVDLIGVDDADAAVVEGIEMVNIIANWAVMAVDMENSVGVAFESGSGDYAEWLMKASPSEIFSYGDIVGVSGGRISKSMQNPEMYMVVSMSPIVLGNMPPQEKTGQYEKVAFMGQVPVKVRGQVAIGDYILASGLNDGFGIAVHPDEMSIEKYDEIVGIAWSASTGTGGFSYINTAVGINANDLTAEISRQQAEIESMKENMNAIVSYLQTKDPDFDASIFEIEDQYASTVNYAKKSETTATKTDVMGKLISMFEENPEMLEQIMEDARNMLDERGIDYNMYEQTRLMVTDATYYLNVLRSSAW